MQESDSVVLLIQCPDAKGIIASVTNFLHQYQANIIGLDEYVNSLDSMFFMRLEWDLTGFSLPLVDFQERFGSEIAKPYCMEWSLSSRQNPQRMALFASKSPHCLFDLLSRTLAGEWNVEIPLVISNHEDHREAVTQWGFKYFHMPITKGNKADQEVRELELLQEHRIEFVVLARYMQILSPDFIRHFPNQIINIHHSFLPAFSGARPYHQAYERGVKIIGATSHYVTNDLDEGPIIAQGVQAISHLDSVKDMVRKGRDIEKIVLANGIRAHLERRILVYRNRTVVFAK